MHWLSEKRQEQRKHQKLDNFVQCQEIFKDLKIKEDLILNRYSSDLVLYFGNSRETDF